jgi:prophage antirepressor-like protein
MSDVHPSTDLSIFQFEGQRLRVFMDVHRMVWWVATDVCRILGLDNTSLAMKRLKPLEKNTLCFEKGIPGSEGLPGNTTVNLVNEPDLYRLIFRSNKPEAERFQDKVFYEILPSIRRTGTYAESGRPMSAPSHHLPPRARPAQEMAHVSEMLLSVWTTLRQAEDPLTNMEIAYKTRVPLRTVQRHTKYLLQLGLIDLYETSPSHLYKIADQADKRHAASYQRLERIVQVMEQRQRRLFA